MSGAGRLGLIGPGRAGRAVSGALAAAGWTVAAVVGRGDDPAAVRGSELVLVAVPDRAIPGVVAALTDVVGPATLVVHVAGAIGVEALAGLPCRRGALHPLQTLAGAPDDSLRLRGTWFAVEGDPEVEALARACGGHPFPVGDRALYHATGSVASNHLVALFGQVERLAARAGVPGEALWPLVERTIENLRSRGAAAALTGPVARGDVATVATHLAAIGPDERPTYVALAREALRLTGRQDPELAALLARERDGAGVTEVVETIAELRRRLDAARAAGRVVGLVPTMGAFHDGHLSLMRAARAECDLVVVSLFVNPLQFAPTEDLASYPRDLGRDLLLARGVPVELVFHPSVAEMYPTWPPATTVRVAGVSEGLESVTRPHFFEGVATVVAKLFGAVGECRAYFGTKDYQQLCVVRRMAADLRMPVTVVGCPIVREPDGLAMSSRNVHLSADARRAARSLSAALAAGARAVVAGQRDPETVRRTVAEVIEAEPTAELDYAAVVDGATLEPIERVAGTVLIAVAARVGVPRLIDNCTVTVAPDGTATTDLRLPD